MSWDQAKSALKMFDVAIHGLETIQSIVGVGGAPAKDALQIIDAIIQEILNGFAAKATPEAIIASIKTLTDGIAKNDATIDAEIDTKFDKGSAP